MFILVLPSAIYAYQSYIRGVHWEYCVIVFFQVYKSTYAHILFTAVPIHQIKEVREGVTRANYPKERCFTIIYTEGRRSRILELMAHDPADADAWMQGLNFLVNKECRSRDQQG